MDHGSPSRIQRLDMKPLTTLLALTCGLLVICSAFAQPIYKVEDEHGNITYTDQKPDDDAEPIALPEVNVIGQTSPEIEEVITDPGDAEAVEVFELRLTEPADGSLHANSEGRIDLTVSSNLAIPAAAEIVVYLNDEPQPAVTTTEVSVTGLPPDEYRLRAELQTPSGRILATTPEITTRLISVDSR